MPASRILLRLAIITLTPLFASAQSASNPWVTIDSGSIYGPGKLAVSAWPAPPPISAFYSGCETQAGLEIFGTVDNVVQTIVQTAPEGPWTPSAQNTPAGSLSYSFGGYVTSNPAAAPYEYGLDVFARGGDNAVWMNEIVYGSEPRLPGYPCSFIAFQNWTSLGGFIQFDPTVGINADGRLELFAIGSDNSLWHIAQTNPPSTSYPPSPSPWGGWTALGGSLSGTPIVGTNLDGRLEIFAKGTDGALWHIWQLSPGGPWSGWTSLGGVIISNPAIATNADGRLEAFATGTDNALWHIAQSTAGSPMWSGWTSLGGYILSDPAVGRNSDGRLETFVRGGDNAVWTDFQSQAGSDVWSGWTTLGGSAVDAPAIGVNSDGTLTVFTRDATGAAERTQTSPGNWM